MSLIRTFASSRQIATYWVWMLFGTLFVWGKVQFRSCAESFFKRLKTAITLLRRSGRQQPDCTVKRTAQNWPSAGKVIRDDRVPSTLWLKPNIIINLALGKSVDICNLPQEAYTHSIYRRLSQYRASASDKNLYDVMRKEEQDVLMIVLFQPELFVIWYHYTADTRVLWHRLININSMQVELIQLLSPI